MEFLPRLRSLESPPRTSADVYGLSPGCSFVIDVDPEGGLEAPTAFKGLTVADRASKKTDMHSPPYELLNSWSPDTADATKAPVLASKFSILPYLTAGLSVIDVVLVLKLVSVARLVLDIWGIMILISLLYIAPASVINKSFSIASGS